MNHCFRYSDAASEASEMRATSRIYDWRVAVTDDECDVMENCSVPRFVGTEWCTGMMCTVVRERLVGNRPCLCLRAHLHPVVVVGAWYIVLGSHS